MGRRIAIIRQRRPGARWAAFGQAAVIIYVQPRVRREQIGQPIVEIADCVAAQLLVVGDEISADGVAIWAIPRNESKFKYCCG